MAEVEMSLDTEEFIPVTDSSPSPPEQTTREFSASTRQIPNMTSEEEAESEPFSDGDTQPGHGYYSDGDAGSLTGSPVEVDDEDIEDDYPSDPISIKTREDKLRMQALRRHLDKLSEQVLEKDYLVNQSREELKKCQDYIKTLDGEIDAVTKEIDEMEEKNNMAPVFRLRSQYGKLCLELQAEKDLEQQIKERLQQAEYALAQATVEQGRFLLAGEDLEREERQMERQKFEAGAVRIRKENIGAMTAERRRRAREKEHASAIRERERKHRQAITAAKRNREVANKFLKETMTKVRKREAEEEKRNKAALEDRMQSILFLKSNIETNKENLRAIQARDTRYEEIDEEQEEMERQEIITRGLNPDEVMTKRKRIRQFEKDKEAFEKRQREREIDIVNSIMREERQMKKRYQQQPQLWPEKQKDRTRPKTPRRRTKPKITKPTSGSSSMEYSADIEDDTQDYDGVSRPKLCTLSSDEDDEFSPFGHTSRDEAKEGDSDGEKEDLVQPEFRGLWEESPDKLPALKKETHYKFGTHQPSKMELEMMSRALENQRTNIVQKQVAVGREFKGSAFYSKPDVVIFKDFDVGKTYKKKVLLTNVSYTQNSCKYVGLSHNLRDFVEVHFVPPGAMSAGLTCDFTVTFSPMLNEDIEGQVDFLAQTGPFFIPIKCVTKKCQVVVDVTEVDFGFQVVGEVRKKTVVITNNGALGTDFEFNKIVDPLGSETTSVISSLGGEEELESKPATPEVGEDEQNKPEGDMAEERTDENMDTTTGATDTKEESIDNETGCDIGKSGDGVPPVIVEEEELDQVETDSGKAESVLSSVPTEVALFEGMKTGKIEKGNVGPFSSVQLEIVFSPTKAGFTTSDFEISFDDPLSPPILVRSKGIGIDVPVWVEREVVDLKICMFERLYQDAIIVNNRATSALRLKFEVCKELKDHLELLPKTAYIQAESQFSAQLKFLPRASLPQDCLEYFDTETGILEAPMVIRVADQTRPVPFTVKAVVTSSDVEFNVKELDFGFCTVYESVRHTITMTNKSVIPQQFGFCGQPDYLDVQPNDGFGTLLPLQSLDMDVIFSAKKAKEYLFVLTCKTGIGREFKIPCRGVGVLPPLELSHSLIKFRATAIGDTSSSHFNIINSHKSANEFTHPVPRIGSGPIVPVGPTSFEFVVPKGAPITIAPAVGTVTPGESTVIHVTFNPHLSTEQVTNEALRLSEKFAEAEIKKIEASSSAQEKAEVKEVQVQKKKGAKPAPARGKGSPKRGVTPTLSGNKLARSVVKTLTKDDILGGSDEYESAHLSLLRNYYNSFTSFTIPCYIASGECGEPGSLPYSVNNTLYLEVQCPTVRPSIVVMSDCGRSQMDFKSVSIGQRGIKSLTIQNISDESQRMMSSLLDPHGPFQLLNALKTLEPQETYTVIVAFEPYSSRDFYEVLEIQCPKSTLFLRLRGCGVTPSIELSVPNTLDLGDLLVGDTVTSSFKIMNTTELDLNYSLSLDSLSPLRHSRAQLLPRYLQPYDELEESKDHLLGPSNNNGRTVFDCVPAQGAIAPGESKEITVTFYADHPSELYSDQLTVEINNKSEAHGLKIKGRAWSNISFTRGWDQLTPAEESLSALPEEEEDEEQKAIQKTVVLTLKSFSDGEAFLAAERLVDVGCIRSNVQMKKSCEFFFDASKEAAEKGFTFEPQKAGVEVGAVKKVSFKWQPPQGHDPNIPVNTSTVLTVKADVTTQYKVLLKGLITSTERPETAPTTLPSANKPLSTN